MFSRAARLPLALITVTAVFMYAQFKYTGKSTNKLHSKSLRRHDIDINEIYYGNPTDQFPIECEEDITVVTAYFDIGPFKKANSKVTHNTYIEWSSTFKYLSNPLLVYTDSEQFAFWMSKQRDKSENKTIIIILKRNTLWSFRIIGKIRKIYKQPEYPKYHPNTVIPEYSAAMHSKYAVMALAIRNGYFDTKYYAWVDIGCFRGILNRRRPFQLNTPIHFDDSKIALSRVKNANMSVNYTHIFLNNMVWVGGAVFIGSGQRLLDMEQQYKRAVNFFLDKGLMNTDQQILYAMYSDQGRSEVKPNVRLQLYIPDGRFDKWFHLGYICRKELKNTKYKTNKYVL